MKKSQLADCYSFWGVFWVDVSSDPLANSEFLAISEKLEFLAKSIDDVRYLLSNMEHSWLLILDNADDPDFNYQAYFPSGTHGTVIMTSRNARCAGYNKIGSEKLGGLNAS